MNLDKLFERVFSLRPTPTPEARSRGRIQLRRLGLEYESPNLGFCKIAEPEASQSQQLSCQKPCKT